MTDENKTEEVKPAEETAAPAAEAPAAEAAPAEGGEAKPDPQEAAKEAAKEATKKASSFFDNLKERARNIDVDSLKKSAQGFGDQMKERAGDIQAGAKTDSEVPARAAMDDTAVAEAKKKAEGTILEETLTEDVEAYLKDLCPGETPVCKFRCSPTNETFQLVLTDKALYLFDRSHGMKVGIVSVSSPSVIELSAPQGFTVGHLKAGDVKFPLRSEVAYFKAVTVINKMKG